MNNTNITYEERIDQFRNTLPILENPELLTQAIIGKIEFIAARKKESKVYRITCFLSGVAAILLFCLLINETWHPLTPFQMGKSNQNILPVQQPPEMIYQKDKLSDNVFLEKNYLEKIKLYASIIQKKRENKKKIDQLYSDLHQQINTLK